MSELLRYAGVMVCLAVAIGCICRLDQMTTRRNKVGWIGFYIASAAFCGWVCVDLLVQGWVDAYRAAMVACMLGYLWVSRRDWQHGPPWSVTKR